PTPYNASNIPLKPKYFLPISIAGVKDGDFSMTLGYPGSTNRYETSDGIKMKIEESNPSLVNLRDIRLKYMLQEMKKDPTTKLKLASYYAGVANYWKFFDGETKQLKKYHIYEKKQAEEKKFINWAKGKPEFDSLFKKYKANYATWQPYEKGRVYLTEGILGSGLLRFMNRFLSVPEVLQTKDTAKIYTLMRKLNQARENFLKEEDIPSDKNIVAAVLSLFYHDIKKSQQPTNFYDTLQVQYGNLDNPDTYIKYSYQLFNNSLVLNNEKWRLFIKNPSINDLENDLAYQTINSFMSNFINQYRPFYDKFLSVNNNLSRIYLKGIAQMYPTQEHYPDATFTMRLSYGNVKSYRPRDGVFYDGICTLTGMMEKYVPGDYEFDLPKKLIELYQKKDFGRYKDLKKNDIVVNFITTNDITGGNSGSPVLNNKGQLIGLAFDGNYEALSHKIVFDKALNRTICLDVRYLLWCIDKLGSAQNIIEEILLVPANNISIRK
ncbi:MAG: S46 family peptidase, partial [Chitinophagaceae bacterium]